MTVRLFADTTGCAIYDEAPGGGDPLDPNSLMNRPFVSPQSWIDSIYFHSDFAYYGVVAKDMAKVISHAAVAGATTGLPGVLLYGQVVATSHLLLTHGLGYVPKFQVASGGVLLPEGIPIQVGAGGQARFVTPYATATEIRLYEQGYSSDTALVAASITYQAIAFRSSVADPAFPQLNIDPTATGVSFGKGKFRIDEEHLRIAGGSDTPFSISLGRNVDINSGGIRSVPGGVGGPVIDFGGYAGSFAGSPAVQLTI